MSSSQSAVRVSCLLAALAWGAVLPAADAPPVTSPPATAPAEAAPVITRHELRLGERTLRYTVTTGLMPLTSETGEVEAHVFYMAYVAERTGGPATRPLMFSFNGGPGSSSVWLHLGALGPRRVKMRPDGGMPPPPYTLVDNPHTWLAWTDLVFIDPVGTGYSRPTKPDLGKKFWSLAGDVRSVGEFIRLYLTRAERWASPLFLVGESYGTTRAAGLAGHLIDRGIAFNGIVLVSSILNFQTALMTPGNDLPYPLFLPTYTATACHHRRLPSARCADLPRLLSEVEAWAEGDYGAALAKGDTLAPDTRRAVVDRLAGYTGLPTELLERADLRVSPERFRGNLLREQRRTVGRLDTRFTGSDSGGASDEPEFDPSMAAIRPPYTAVFNDYVRRELGYRTDTAYHILGGGIDTPWDFGASGPGGFADTSEALRSALAKNPDMRVFVASGHFDLATPYFATRYTLAHMGLDSATRARISSADYAAGHMMYIHEKELERLSRDVGAFVSACLRNGTS